MSTIVEAQQAGWLGLGLSAIFKQVQNFAETLIYNEALNIICAKNSVISVELHQQKHKRAENQSYCVCCDIDTASLSKTAVKLTWFGNVQSHQWYFLGFTIVTVYSSL